jgi:hypothetical protein
VWFSFSYFRSGRRSQIIQRRDVCDQRVADRMTEPSVALICPGDRQVSILMVAVYQIL